MIITLTDQTVKDYWKGPSAKDFLILDFWSPRCEGCRFNASLLEEVVKEFPKNLDVAKVNVEFNPFIVAEHDIRLLPSLALFHSGKFIGKISGVPSREQLLKTLGI